MTKGPETLVRRRDLLRSVLTGAAAAAALRTVAGEPAAALPRNAGDKRKARYQANSAEVQEFYRVNRYPAR
jgi:hypothetical protein